MPGTLPGMVSFYPKTRYAKDKNTMKDTITVHLRGGGTRVILRKKCPVCQKQFFPRRKSAVYCSPACKQKQYRIRENARRARHNEIVRQLKMRGVL